jgi:medium-chain acyl-[acyl-carrier-protein] hydrolase
MIDYHSWILQSTSASHIPKRLRLFCFSCAGGNAASFIPWQYALEPDIELCAIQLPGRGESLGAPTVRSFSELMARLAPAVAPAATLPFAFFGHSLGGLVAFELARRFQSDGGRMPFKLLIAGCDRPRHRKPTLRLHDLDDDARLQALREFGGTSPEILENRDLMDLAMPSIVGDFALLSDYRYNPGRPLDTPLTLMLGRGDQHVDRQTAMSWQEETLEPMTTHWFDGGHFFIHSQREAVIDCVRSELTQWNDLCR